MNSAGSELKKTALWACHKALGARLVPFAGYDMPVQYTGVMDEHHTVRNQVGIFDVSHMGLARLSGAQAFACIDHLVTRNLAKLHPGRAAYGVMCHEHGGSIDDLIIYRRTENEFYLVLNAGNKEKDLTHIRTQAARYDVEVEGPLDDAILALQGPQAFPLLAKMGYAQVNERKAFDFVDAKLGDISVMLAFTGYTGEKGCEIFVPNQHAEAIWKLALEAGAAFGIKAIGLGARDTLRTEMGYSLYGHELSDDIQPLEAGLAWVVNLQKEFIGQAALKTAQVHPKRKIIYLRSEGRQAPRPDMPVLAAGQVVGKITSGTFSPTLGHAIGIALVDVTSSGPYSVDIRGSQLPFELTHIPFVSKGEKS